jgi:hypothetical protein
MARAGVNPSTGAIPTGTAVVPTTSTAHDQALAADDPATAAMKVPDPATAAMKVPDPATAATKVPDQVLETTTTTTADDPVVPLAHDQVDPVQRSVEDEDTRFFRRDIC